MDPFRPILLRCVLPNRDSTKYMSTSLYKHMSYLLVRWMYTHAYLYSYKCVYTCVHACRHQRPTMGVGQGMAEIQCLPLQSWDYGHMSLCLAFRRGTRDWTQAINQPYAASTWSSKLFPQRHPPRFPPFLKHILSAHSEMWRQERTLRLCDNQNWI